MPGKVFLAGFRTHVFGEKFRIGVHEIDVNEPVEAIGEGFVQVETEKRPAETQVVFEQNGNALAVGFQAGDDRGEIIHLAEVGGDEFTQNFRAASKPLKGLPGPDTGGQMLVAAVLPEKIHHQPAGKLMVILADAHRSKQPPVLGVSGDPAADAFPEQLQGKGIPLPAGNNEAAAHFQGIVQSIEEWLPEFEKSVRVKPARAVLDRKSVV